MAKREGVAKKILIATDGSEPARDATKYAIELARRLGWGLIALRVVDIDRYASEFEAVRDVVAKELEEQASRILGEAQEMASQMGLEMEAQVRHGDSSREIIRFAQENAEVALVVMGASGRRRLGRQLIGSTAERVVRQVSRDMPCPVMITPCYATNPEVRLDLDK